jgi:hypothetical protein
VSKEHQAWTVEHFSLANPKGLGQDDVPALLRRVANSLEDRGPVEVQDLVFHTEITDEGAWHEMTVYFHSDAASDPT